MASGHLNPPDMHRAMSLETLVPVIAAGVIVLGTGFVQMYVHRDLFVQGF